MEKKFSNNGGGIGEKLERLRRCLDCFASGMQLKCHLVFKSGVRIVGIRFTRRFLKSAKVVKHVFNWLYLLWFSLFRNMPSKIYGWLYFVSYFQSSKRMISAWYQTSIRWNGNEFYGGWGRRTSAILHQVYWRKWIIWHQAIVQISLRVFIEKVHECRGKENKEQIWIFREYFG